MLEQKNIEQILNDFLNELYANNGRKIKRICNQNIRKFSFLSQKDYDDFYSAVNEACAIAITTYQKQEGCLEGYIYRTIKFAIINELRRKNRQKRQADVQSISFDMPVGENENTTLEDFIASDFDIEKEIFPEEDDVMSHKIQQYLQGLSRRQKKIVEGLVASCNAVEIQTELHITKKDYNKELHIIRSYEKIKILFE